MAAYIEIFRVYWLEVPWSYHRYSPCLIEKPDVVISKTTNLT